MRAYPLYHFDCGSIQHQLKRYNDLSKLPDIVEQMHEDEDAVRVTYRQLRGCPPSFLHITT